MAVRDKTKRTEFGHMLRKARVAAGLSREDVAKHVGVTRQAVYLWEAGQSWPGANYYFKLHQLYKLGDQAPSTATPNGAAT